MSMIPVVASAEEIPDAIRYAETHANSRWYISRRAEVLGRPDLVPPDWGLTASLTFAPTKAAGPTSTAERMVKKAGVKTKAVRGAPVPQDAADGGPGDIAAQLARIQQLSDSELDDLAGRITAEFHAADEVDDLDAMKQCGAWIDAVTAEQERRQAPAPKSIAASARSSSTMAAPVVPADRAPRGTGGKRSGNVILAASGTRPTWEHMYTPAEPREFEGPGVSKREAARLAETETLARIARAQQADRESSAELDRLRLASSKVDACVVAEQWPALFGLLYAAARANEHAPAWPVTVLLTAMLGQDATIQPLLHEFPALQSPRLGPVGAARTDWAMAWHLCIELAGSRTNATPDPSLAVRTRYRSPECSWTAVTGDGLVAAMLELQTEHDPTARVKDNKIIGDSPITRLAGQLVGPARIERGLPGDHLARHGPGSAMVRLAEQLRGGAPEQPDLSVLASLTDEQRQALASLAVGAAT